MNTLRITVWPKVSGVNLVMMEESRQGRKLADIYQGKLRLDMDALNAASTDLEYGEELGRGLFADLQGPFALALNNAAQDAENAPALLRVLLQVEDGPLSEAVRWERLCMPQGANWIFLAGHQGTPFSFYLRPRAASTFPPIGPQKLRALLLVSGPKDLGISNEALDFSVPEVIRAVTGGMRKGEISYDVLADSEAGAAAGVPVVGKPDLPTLVETLTRGKYKLLHIVCHGGYFGDEEQYTLLLPNSEGKPTTQGEFIGEFTKLRPGAGLPYFTFLMACHSASRKGGLRQNRDNFGGLGQQLVRQFNLPGVLAMTNSVSVSTANKVASSFYSALTGYAEGQLDLALSQSLVTLGGQFDQTVPALFTCLDTLALFIPGVDDRPLEDFQSNEVADGLKLFRELMYQRAPVLKPEVDRLCAILDRYADVDVRYIQDRQAKEERLRALEEVQKWSAQALGVNFNGLVQNSGILPDPSNGRNPFPGLLRFDLSNKNLFFGRKELTETLKQRISEYPFLAVLGDSGTGKSSVVLAGLVPALGVTSQSLPGYLTPTQDPVSQLKAALARLDAAPHEPRLLVVDQFEELFTQCKDAEQREAFVEMMLAQVSAPPYNGTCKVIITLRADFYRNCASIIGLQDEVPKHNVLIASMNPVDLRNAMEQQAAAVGLRFEEGLSELILRDLQTAPEPMPLLQFALSALWERRHGPWLMREEYEKFEGIQGVITNQANAFYERLKDEPWKQALVRNIFIRLTRLGSAVGEGAEGFDTRQRVPLEALVPDQGRMDDVVAMVNELENQRLVLRRANMVEVAHEALIRGWKQLRVWLNEQRAKIMLRDEISGEADNWHARGRPIDETYLVCKGPRLADALRIGEGGLTLNELEAAYLQACSRLAREQLSMKAEANIRITSAEPRSLILDLILPSEDTWSEPTEAELTGETELEMQQNITTQVTLDTVRLTELKGDGPAYGQALAEMLFTGPALRLLEQACAEEKPLAVRIGISDDYEELHSIDWELLSDAPLLRGRPVTRLMKNAGAEPFPNRSLRALVILAPPDGDASWNGAAESERICGQISGDFQKTCLIVGQADPDEIWSSLSDPCDLLYLQSPLNLVKDEIRFWQEGTGRAGVNLRRLLNWLWLSSRPPRMIVLESNLPPQAHIIQPRQCGIRLEQVRMLEEINPMFVLWLPEGAPEESRARFFASFMESLQQCDYAEQAMAQAWQSARPGAALPGGHTWLPMLFTSQAWQPIWHSILDLKGQREVGDLIEGLLAMAREYRVLPVIGPGVVDNLLGSSRCTAYDIAVARGIPFNSTQALRLSEVVRGVAVRAGFEDSRRMVADQYQESIRRHILRRISPDIRTDFAAIPDINEFLFEAFKLEQDKKDRQDALFVLARLPIPIYLTTNMDPLLVGALRAAGKDPVEMIFPWKDFASFERESELSNAYQPRPEQPLVFCLFGQFSLPESLVLMDEDHFDFIRGAAANRDRIPTAILAAIANCSHLILGYEPESLALQALFQLLNTNQGFTSRRIPHAIQLEPVSGAEASAYLFDRMNDYRHRVLWGTTEEVLEKIGQGWNRWRA